MSDLAYRVLFVKKLLAGGEPCRKCRDVEARLRKDDLMRHVDEIIVAREDDPDSPGARLASRLGVRQAPFFVVRQQDGRERVIESYLAFKRWFCQSESAVQDLAGTVDQHPDLALI